MIYVEDELIKLNGVVLPGLVKSIEVIETAKVDEQEVEGSATKPKQATGYEDAKVNIELIIDDTPSQTKYQRYATLRAIFRSPGQSVPQPIPIISEDTAAHGVEKVIFKKLSHKGENKRGQLTAMFVSHAGGAWLDLKMADYSKKRKKAQKTQGFVTVSRTDMTGEAVKIPKGHVFKSILDINGEELRFFVLEAATLQKGASSVDVLVEAETEGSRYNVPAGQIVRTLTYLGDVTFSNAEDWIVREGSDTEDDESARARTLRSWSELAQRATEDTFIDAAESVPGVLFAQADCNHPRGQGTVDVIVTGTAGEATEGLLAAVREAVDKIAGPYDNILVKSSVTVSQNISVTVTTDTADTDEAVENRVKAILTELLAVRRSRKLNELTLSDINHAIRSGYSGATNAAVSEPEADVKLGKDKVITLGDVSVTVERE